VKTNRIANACLSFLNIDVARFANLAECGKFRREWIRLKMILLIMKNLTTTLLPNQRGCLTNHIDKQQSLIVLLDNKVFVNL